MRLLLPALFLLVIALVGVSVPIPPVAAADSTVEDFEYDSVWWEDWTPTTTSVTPTTTWNPNNHTMRLSATVILPTTGYTAITRPLTPKSDRLDVSWYARHIQALNDSYPAWWNTSWLWRKPIPVNGSSAGAVTNYQIPFFLMAGVGSDSINTIYLNGRAQADYDDVRFIYEGTTVCDLWYEKVTASVATVWVEVPALAIGPTVTKLYMYYGNPTATSIASGANTFLVFNPWTSAPSSYTAGTFTVVGSTWINESTLGTGTSWHGPASYNATLTESQSTGLRVRSWYDFSAELANAQLGKVQYSGSSNANATQWTWGIQDSQGATKTTTVFLYRYVPTLTVIYESADLGAINNTLEFRLWENTGTDYWIYTNWTLNTSGDNDFDFTTARWNIAIQQYSTYQMAERAKSDWVFYAKWITPEPIATGGLEQYQSSSASDQVFRVRLPYTSGSNTHFVNVTYSKTNVTLAYYSGAGVLQSQSVAVSLADAFAYLTTTLLLTNPVGPKMLTVTVKLDGGGTVASFTTTNPEITPSDAKSLVIEERGTNPKYSYYRAEAEIVTVKAPFPAVSGLRAWQTTGLNSTETPYSIRIGYSAGRTATVKVMPFQGLKWLWNVTMAPGTGLAGDSVSGGITVTWYSFAGTVTGNVTIRLTSLVSYPSSGSVSIRTNGVLRWGKSLSASTGISVAIWTEKSGKTYAYIQYTPHSSEYQDFFIYDLTSVANLNSWGVAISHTTSTYTTYCAGQSYMSEVEIFYGMREGISQPRFGGMWWENNPVIMFFLGLANIIASWFIGLANIIVTIFGPVVSAVATTINNFAQGLINTVITVLNDLAAMIGNWLVTFFIPALQAFIEGFILVALAVVLAPAVGILAVLSTLLFGDPTLLPVVVVNFCLAVINFFAFINLGLGALLNFFTVLGLYLSGQPIGYIPNSSFVGLIGQVIYYVVTYAPLAIVLHVMVSVLRCLPQGTGAYDFDIEPLINCGLFYYHIIAFVATAVYQVVSFITSIIISIMELVPF